MVHRTGYAAYARHIEAARGDVDFEAFRLPGCFPRLCRWALTVLKIGEPAHARGRNAPSGQLLDHLEQLRSLVATLAAELDQLDRLREQRAALGCAADADAVTRAELEQTFVS